MARLAWMMLACMLSHALAEGQEEECIYRDIHGTCEDSGALELVQLTVNATTRMKAKNRATQTSTVLQALELCKSMRAGSTLSGVVLGIVVALSGSVDDCVWFLTFASSSNWKQLWLCYMVCNMFVAFACWSLSLIFQEVINQVASEQNFYLGVTITATLMLFAVTVWKWWEWIHEEDTEEEEKEREDSTAAQQAKHRSAAVLISIAIPGNLNNCTIFLPALLERQVSGPYLILGSFVASSSVLLIDLLALKVPAVRSLVQRLPLFMIVGLLAILSLKDLLTEISKHNDLVARVD
eukprot:TRINITY_DN62380_c0_g1_i1.p1 TRINITY_DN62380_c0_g1~~TRINITY_DN62380_c0_g1_i1.p1  ORF type:complete len:306 (+),score=67.77 TRINITY_DN62380_c0_g1_i1:36-920(+)